MQLQAFTSKEESTPGDIILESEVAFVEEHSLVVGHSLARDGQGKTLIQPFYPSPVTVQKQGWDHFTPLVFNECGK